MHATHTEDQNINDRLNRNGYNCIETGISQEREGIAYGGKTSGRSAEF